MLDKILSIPLTTLRDLSPAFEGLGKRHVKMEKRIQGRQKSFSTGSLVPGYGSGDKVPALLEPGEFVLNRNAVSKVGHDKLNYLNQKYSRKGFQEGGTVSTAQPISSINSESFLQAARILDGVATKMENVVKVVNGLHLQHTFNGTVTVQIVGAQFMTQISKEMQTICNVEIKKVLSNFASKKLNINNIE